MRHFQAQNGAFAPNNFFWKIINIILNIIYLLVHFIVRNFKKIFQQIQSYEDVQFLGPKWPISPNENFFRKHVNEPKSDINRLEKYWQLKNTEISLAESHFWL